MTRISRARTPEAESPRIGAISYESALQTNRKEIFSLPDETIICPGHGPLTTVGEQKMHNPFFAA